MIRLSVVITVSWARRVLFRPVSWLIALQIRCTRFFDGVVLLRASPSPQTARPASPEASVDRQGDHRWGFPCCGWSPLPPCRRHYPGRSDGTNSLVLFHQRRPSLNTRWVGSCVNRCRVEETGLCFRLSLALSAVSGFVRV